MFLLGGLVGVIVGWCGFACMLVFNLDFNKVLAIDAARFKKLRRRVAKALTK